MAVPHKPFAWLMALLALTAGAFPLGAAGQFGVRPDGSKVATWEPRQTHAVVLFFVASACPISDRTFPEMKRVRERFSARGVRVYFVYPNTTEQLANVTTHQQAFDPGGSILLDPAGDLVRLTHARVTPQASVLVPEEGRAESSERWRSVYSGRVDDRFLHLGLERPQPSHFFVEEALDAVLDNRPVPKGTGTPVGCGIVNPGAMGISSGQ